MWQRSKARQYPIFRHFSKEQCARDQRRRLSWKTAVLRVPPEAKEPANHHRPPRLEGNGSMTKKGCISASANCPRSANVQLEAGADDILSDIIRTRALHRFDTTSTLVGGWGVNSKLNISNKMKTSKCRGMDIFCFPYLAMKIWADTEKYFLLFYFNCGL
jgi:hypothetical protein